MSSLSRNFIFIVITIISLLPILAFPTNLRQLMLQSISFRKDGKIHIPSNIKHIKIDIGLSYSAPMSQYWLSHERDLYVFGFEPNLSSVQSILKGAKKQHFSHGEPLESRFLGTQFFLIPVALGSYAMSGMTMPFYVTKNDCGCSSLYRPKELPIDQIINVPVFSLTDFFDLFPFDTHPVIEYIKIDAQGADLEIVKGAGSYLTEKVIYITLEPENNQYENTVNSQQSIDAYMKSIGFSPHKSPHAADPTYFNSRFSSYIKEDPVLIYQKG